MSRRIDGLGGERSRALGKAGVRRFAGGGYARQAPAH